MPPTMGFVMALALGLIGSAAATDEAPPSTTAATIGDKVEMKLVTERVAKDNSMLANLLVHSNKQAEQQLKEGGLVTRRCERKRRQRDTENRRLRRENQRLGLRLARAKQQIADSIQTAKRTSLHPPDLSRLLAPRGPQAGMPSRGGGLKGRSLGDSDRVGAASTVADQTRRSGATRELHKACEELTRLRKKTSTKSSNGVPPCYGDKTCIKILESKQESKGSDEMQCLSDKGRWCPAINFVGSANVVSYCTLYCNSAQNKKVCPAHIAHPALVGVAQQIKKHKYVDPLKVCDGTVLDEKLILGKDQGRCMLNSKLRDSSDTDGGPKAAKWLPLWYRQWQQNIACSGGCLRQDGPERGQCIPGCYDGILTPEMAVLDRRYNILSALDGVIMGVSQIFAVTCSTVPPLGCPWPGIRWKRYNNETNKVEWVKGYNTMQQSKYMSKERWMSLPKIILPQESKAMQPELMQKKNEEGWTFCPKPFDVGEMLCNPCNKDMKSGKTCDRPTAKQKRPKNKWPFMKLYADAKDTTPDGGSRFAKPVLKTTGKRKRNLGESATKTRRRRMSATKTRRRRMLDVSAVVGGAASALAGAAAPKIARMLKGVLRTGLKKLVKTEPWLEPLHMYLRCIVVDILTSFKSFSISEMSKVFSLLGKTLSFDFKKGALPNKYKGDGGYLIQALRAAFTRLLLQRIFPTPLLKWLEARGESAPHQLEAWCAMASDVFPLSHHLHGGKQMLRVLAAGPERRMVNPETSPGRLPNMAYGTHKAMPETASWYIVRARSDHLLGYRGGEGLAHKWVTCLDEFLQRYENSEALQKKFPTFERYLKSNASGKSKFLFPKTHKQYAEEKRLFPDGHPFQVDCLKVLREKKDVPESALKYKKGPGRWPNESWRELNAAIYPVGVDKNSKQRWSGCTTRLKVYMGRCTTCCCKGGMFDTRISNALVQGKRTDCGAFFSTTDALARMVISGLRIVLIANTYAHTCFSAAVLNNGMTGLRVTTPEEQRASKRRNDKMIKEREAAEVKKFYDSPQPQPVAKKKVSKKTGSKTKKQAPKKKKKTMYQTLLARRRSPIRRRSPKKSPKRN